ncbi:MAG: carboxylating nicotinate-nucleotide diphosphorylase [Firmicutes bacterium]|nr:carboxylating nicotinate-nucleotide diphosphorylase [Bacillota bacterium]
MLSPWIWQDFIATALKEDVGFGDITTQALIPPTDYGRLQIIAREPMTVAGLDSLMHTYHLIDSRVSVCLHARDGQTIPPHTALASLTGPTQALLTGERVCLNILQRLSGIATATAHIVALLQDLPVTVLDTRKTTVGWRVFEKYAVSAGGARNHRMRLDDAVLIKDNHIAAVGSVSGAIARARQAVGPTVFVEVEVDTPEQMKEAVQARPDGILLDNMSVNQLREAVQWIDHRVWTEASGGITPDTVREIAETGVDAVSLGWLTHSVPAVDIGADWREAL